MGCGGSKSQAPGPQEASKHTASQKGEVQRQSGSVRRAITKQDEQKPVQPKYEEVRIGCYACSNPSVHRYQPRWGCMSGTACGRAGVSESH